MIEGSWLCLVLVLFSSKRLEEDKLFCDEEDVRFSYPKTVETFFARNLLPDKPAKRISKFCWKSAHCYIENFTANSEKILLGLAENQLKGQFCYLASRMSFSDTVTLYREAAVLSKLSKAKFSGYFISTAKI